MHNALKFKELAVFILGIKGFNHTHLGEIGNKNG